MFLVWLGFCYLKIIAHAKHTAISTRDFNAISSGLSQFSQSLYQNVAFDQANNGKNLLISPFSVSVALGMVHAGTRGNTAQQLKTALRLPGENEMVNNFFANLMENMRGNASVTLDVANKIYVASGIDMLCEFRNVTTNLFKSDSENINFADRNAVHKINKWVERKTRNKIRELLPNDAVDSDTKFVLVNAVYFKANWLIPFEKEETTIKPFYLGINDQKVNVPMMKITTLLRYRFLPDLDAKILELPYSVNTLPITLRNRNRRKHMQGSQMSFFIVLPRERNGLQLLERNFLSRNDLEEILQNMSLEQVDVEIPKFKLESSVELVPNLKQMGISDLFNERRADLSGMANITGSAVSEVFHKTFIEVNENGSEAAAAAAAIILAITSDYIEFVADHPFLFFIRNNALNSILFIGRLMDPTK